MMVSDRVYCKSRNPVGLKRSDLREGLTVVRTSRNAFDIKKKVASTTELCTLFSFDRRQVSKIQPPFSRANFDDINIVHL